MREGGRGEGRAGQDRGDQVVVEGLLWVAVAMVEEAKAMVVVMVELVVELVVVVVVVVMVLVVVFREGGYWPVIARMEVKYGGSSTRCTSRSMKRPNACRLGRGEGGG